MNCFQVKLLLEILIKKCGLEAVKAVMPEEHMKLLTNIRKVGGKSSYARIKTYVGIVSDLCDTCQTQIKERNEKKLRANSEARSQLSKATTSRFQSVVI